MGISYRGLFKFDGINWTQFKTDTPYRTFSIAIDKNNDIWICNTWGLYQFSENEWTFFDNTNSSIPSPFATRVVVIDDKNNKWIASGSYLVKYADNKWTNYNSTDDITSIVIDSEGYKWIGTYSHGLYKFDDLNWINYNTKNSKIPNDYILLIAVDNYNNKWIATPSGLAVFKEGGVEGEGGEGVVSTPVKYSISQNYPNPFNPSTTIKYSIPEHSNVIIKVFDLLGREITTLVNEDKAPGNYKVEFNGSKFTSGIYFYRLEANEFSETKKLILLR